MSFTSWSLTAERISQNNWVPLRATWACQETILVRYCKRNFGYHIDVILFFICVNILKRAFMALLFWFVSGQVYVYY